MTEFPMLIDEDPFICWSFHSDAYTLHKLILPNLSNRPRGKPGGIECAVQKGVGSELQQSAVPSDDTAAGPSLCSIVGVSSHFCPEREPFVPIAAAYKAPLRSVAFVKTIKLSEGRFVAVLSSPTEVSCVLVFVLKEIVLVSTANRNSVLEPSGLGISDHPHIFEGVDPWMRIKRDVIAGVITIGGEITRPPSSIFISASG